MENAIISILGTNNGPDQRPDAPVELITDGRFYKEGDAYVVAYQESELTGMTGTTTTFHITRDKITLSRAGDVNTQMVFEKHRKHVSLMETPFGAITVGVCATKLTDNLNDSGGVATVVYDVEIDHEKAGTNSIVVSVKGAVS